MKPKNERNLCQKEFFLVLVLNLVEVLRFSLLLLLYLRHLRYILGFNFLEDSPENHL